VFRELSLLTVNKLSVCVLVKTVMYVACRALNNMLGFTRIFRIMVSEKKVCRLVNNIPFHI